MFTLIFTVVVISTFHPLPILCILKNVNNVSFSFCCGLTRYLFLYNVYLEVILHVGKVWL